MYIKWMNTCIKTRTLTDCCCAGSGEDVMEGLKRDKCINKVNEHKHKKARILTGCYCTGFSEESVMKCLHKVDEHMT